MLADVESGAATEAGSAWATVSAVTSSEVASSIKRSIAFLSSRTLPGHGCWQRGNRLGGETHGLPAVGGAHLPREVLDERRNVLLAIAKRRQAQGEDVHAMEQILPEFAVAHLRFKVPVRGDDHAHIHLDGVSATRSTSPSSRTRSSLACMVNGIVADLVEQEGAVLRLLEFAQLARRRLR